MTNYTVSRRRVCRLPHQQIDNERIVRTLLARYDALPDWTLTESRYVEEHSDISRARILSTIRTIRKAQKASRGIV